MTTPSEVIPINLIERRVGETQYHIKGKGVTVAFLVDYIGDSAWPVERVGEAYGLEPAEIYAAWAFYYEHRAEIDEIRRRNREFYNTLPDIRAHLERKRREREAQDSNQS